MKFEKVKKTNNLILNFIEFCKKLDMEKIIHSKSAFFRLPANYAPWNFPELEKK